ncbi:Tat (twin-arginine translocation) pathway signal sequence [Halobiforma haloterrestris]|uniref:Tat (Twin-arginine translocation) pathway signal sequence n=1 Tax=Natronobacterium haloterrestre TaxID=148448 RepID=A0A1I1JPJ3_NATHA|nr:twin-arginine translocation signal domain-containing protein [Halobiforma haloterrestris]SFC50101.1 Tat (twin-arginine translocation) pathway signal sequence [Halobiforma haloterrestris]
MHMHPKKRVSRRRFLAGTAALGAVGTAGCLSGSDLPVVGSSVDTEFERTDVELAAHEPPDVTVGGDTVTVTVRGTVEFGSSECGTVDLAHAEYEYSQERLDLLVVAADDSGVRTGCSDDLVEAGYRLEATVGEGFRRIVATEHHVFGQTYSTTVEGVD